MLLSIQKTKWVLNIVCICLLSVLLAFCKSEKNQGASNTNNINIKTKENYLANEANKAIEYNKEHKSNVDKNKEKLRKEEEINLNKINHQKHEPVKNKKREEGQFKMY